MTEHQATPEKEAYDRLLGEKVEMLSEAARTVLGGAEFAAYAMHAVHNVCFQPEEYDETIEEMRLAATDITGRDRELLSELWRAALAAAASIDPDDETPAGRNRDWGDVHWYFRTVSGMIEQILQEKKIAEFRETAAKREPEDPNDIPF